MLEHIYLWITRRKAFIYPYRLLTWGGAIQNMLQWLSWPHGCCSCGKRRSTNCWLQNWRRWHACQIRIMGNIRDFVGHSFEQKHRRRGAPHSSEDVHVPCVYVSITSDKKIFPSRQISAEKLLHVCLGSVSVFKLTWSQATEIKLATLQLRRPEVARHMKSACFSFGSTVWFIQPIRRESRITERHQPLELNTLFLVPTRTSHSWRKLSEESKPTLILLNWPRKQRVLATVAWCPYVNGDTHG